MFMYINDIESTTIWSVCNYCERKRKVEVQNKVNSKMRLSFYRIHYNISIYLY